MLRGGVKRHDSCNCSARIKHRRCRLSEESCLDGLKEVGTLFSECREIGSNGAEGIGPVIGAESAGDFLFELGHADGAFGEMVMCALTRHDSFVGANPIRPTLAPAGKYKVRSTR